MSFRDEMKQIFLRVAAGEVEPKEWEAWWNVSTTNLMTSWYSWRADAYLFGVWNLLTGKEAQGYAYREECVSHNSDYMEKLLKEFPKSGNDPRDAMPVHAVLSRSGQKSGEGQLTSNLMRQFDYFGWITEKDLSF